jgi:NRPS condensation-like uncharacterized protein
VTTLRDAPGTAAPPAAPVSWPFTSIEELDFFLENTGEPSLVQMETHVLGHLDRPALEAAVAGALAADPAARRRLAGTSRWHRRLRWESGAPARHTGPGLVTVVAWNDPGELAGLREHLSGRPMSLNDGAARVILAVGPAHDVVILHTHHAAFDGISSLALLNAICAGYRNRVAARDGADAGGGAGARDPATAGHAPAGAPAAGGGPAPRTGLRPPRHDTAPHQAAAPPQPKDSGRRRPGLAPLPGTVTRIAAQGGQPGRPGYGAVLRSIPVPRPVRGDRGHQGHGPFPTVNDVLVAALILAVDRWNAAHGRRSGRIRITVPVNTRSPDERWQGPGNLSRLIRVTARAGHRTDPARLLAHVAAQTRVGKLEARPGLDAVSRLLAAGWAPAPVKRHTVRMVRRLARPVCTDTSLVSNLGVVPEPPSFSGGQEPLWFSGPAPMPRGLAVGAVTVAGRLHLSVHYRPALLDPVAAEDFTDAYRRALAELAGLPQGRPP